MSEDKSRVRRGDDGHTPRQPDGTRLGDVIRQARLDLGLAASHVADVCGAHKSTLARLEAGDFQSVHPNLLRRLARLLELDERDLFALAGLELPEGLPTFTPYLRAKYDISDEAAKELQNYFHYVVSKYDVKEKQPPAA